MVKPVTEHSFEDDRCTLCACVRRLRSLPIQNARMVTDSSVTVFHGADRPFYSCLLRCQAFDLE